MKALASQLRAIAADLARRPDLFDALTGHGRARYALHRLRFFAPRVVLRTVLHAVEVSFLAQFLAIQYVAPLLGYRAMAGLMSGTSWGVLESLRNGVRRDVAAGHPQRARMRIEAWLSLAWLASAIVMVGVTAWIALRPDFEDEPGFTLPDAYGFACMLRFALELVARTYQAGIAALRRVYRPFSLSIAPDLMELGLVIAAWPRLGPWGFPLAITLGGVLRALVTWRYARRGYEGTRIGTPRFSALKKGLSRLSRKELAEGLVHALANATTQVDAILLFVLAHAPAGHEGTVTFAMLFYALRPVIGAAQGFTRLFYFDWKRLERGFGVMFRPAFRRMLFGTSALVSLLALALVALPFAFFPGQPIPPAMYALGPFLFARGLFALEQLEAFSLGALRVLLKSTGFVLSVVLVAWIARLGETTTLLVTSSALYASVLAQVRARRQHTQPATGPALPAWLVRLRERSAVRLCVMQVDAQVTSLARLQRALRREGRDFVRLGRHHLAFFEVPSLDPAAARVELLASAGGALRAMALQDFARGEAALAAPALTARLPPSHAARDEELVHAFAKLTGTVLDLRRGRGTTGLEHDARKTLVRALAGSARAQRRRHGPRVVVLYRAGAPALAFVSPRGEPGFPAFARRVYAASVTDAVTRGAGR